MKFTNKKFGKPLVLIASMMLVAAVAVVGTIAWLQASTTRIDDTFRSAAVTGTVYEDFNGSSKQNVRVKNESNIDVYVRVSLVPTWQDVSGNILPDTASVEHNLNFTLGTDWFRSGDYYYYTGRVAPDAFTNNLADTIYSLPQGAACMNLQVLSEVIQADPADAVQEAWGVTVNTDGTIDA